MKKIIVICFLFFLCIFAQEDDDDLHIILDTVEVYSFKVGNTEKVVVAYWYEDKQNLTTVVSDPAQNGFWAISHGGFLSHPIIDLMNIGVDFEWYGKQIDTMKIMPTYIYKIFTHTDLNYDSILRTDWSFINLLPMEKNEIAGGSLLQYLETAEYDSLAVNVDFVRSFDSEKRKKYFDSLSMTFDSVEMKYFDMSQNKYIYHWEYFVKTNKTQILPVINSGLVTKATLNGAETDKIIRSMTAIGGGKQSSKKFSVIITNNTVRFSQKLPNNSVINIYAPNGKVIYSSKITGNNHKLPNMAKGVYLLKVSGGSSAIIFSKKFML